MARRSETVVWTAGAAGVVLGGILGVLVGGAICVAGPECGLEGLLFVGWGAVIGIPAGGLGCAGLARWLRRTGRVKALMVMGAVLGAVLGFATALLIGIVGSWSVQPVRFVPALIVLVPLFALGGARMARGAGPS